MAYQLLQLTRPKAAKEYQCIWCPEKIPPGMEHVHEASVYDGDFQDHRWHPECWDAAKTYFATTHEEEFGAHECKRGTTQAA